MSGRGGATRVEVARSVGRLPADQWDALTAGNPFVSHAFLASLEDSGSVGGRTGWDPAPVVIRGADGRLAAAMPAYLKSHSQGEYVFDHAWADAWHRAGGHYYPKLQIASPFTPATGPRLLCGDPSLAPALIAGAEALCRQNGLSSAHATFLDPEQAALFAQAGWLLRHDIQFHWENRGYSSFDDFLATLASAKRKNLRKERAAAQAGLEIRAIGGNDLAEAHWDAFWHFYQDTGTRKWGRPYLTRRAFSLIGERMADSVLLFMAYQDGEPVAGALNFIGPDALYGRYWGTVDEVPFLHFELCYYQAIEWACANGLARVEAGAQGEHKIARGYEPVVTRSAHYIPNASFRAAVADFVEAERTAIDSEIEWLRRDLPYRSSSAP